MSPAKDRTVRPETNLRVGALRISPNYTSVDWQALVCEDPTDWAQAADVVRDRLEGRFLRFATDCLKHKDSGFVVLSIDCLLAETIQQFREGLIDSKNQSAAVVMRFLEGPRFREDFPDEAVRRAFYGDIRCGLLHQAEARSLWVIRRKRRSMLQQTQTQNGTAYVVGPAKLKSAMVRATMRTLALGLRRDLIEVDEICRSRRS